MSFAWLFLHKWNNTVWTFLVSGFFYLFNTGQYSILETYYYLHSQVSKSIQVVFFLFICLGPLKIMWWSSLCVPVFMCAVKYTLRNGCIMECMYSYNFSRYCQIDFKAVNVIITPQEFLLAPYPHKILLLTVFIISAIWVDWYQYHSLVFISIFLMTDCGWVPFHSWPFWCCLLRSDCSVAFSVLFVGFVVIYY